GSAVLVVGKGAASGKEEGKFSALLAPRQPDWVASPGCRKSPLRAKAVGLQRYQSKCCVHSAAAGIRRAGCRKRSR
ncbi:hypothetical protein CV951_019760, partial [Acinetobacter baumannii]